MPVPIIILIQIIAFVDLLAVGLIVPFIANHVRNMGGNHIHVGLLGSIYSTFQLGSGPLIGSLSDIKGRKTILTLTLLLCSAAYITLGLTTSITIILIMRAVLGLFKQTQMLTRALVPDYEKSELKQSLIYGKMAAISGIGITVGPVIGGHIVEDHLEKGFTIVAVLSGICFAINAGLVLFLPHAKYKTNVSRKVRIGSAEHSNNILTTIGTNIKQSVVQLCDVDWPKFWDIFLIKALIAFAMSCYFSNYSIYLKTEFGLAPKAIGYIISFQGTVTSVVSYCIGFIHGFYPNDEDYSLRNLHVFILMSMSLAGMIWSHSVTMYIIWLVPLAVGGAVARLVSLDMLMKRSHGEHRGTLIGASNSVRSLSGVVAPLVAGFVGQYFGVVFVIHVSLLFTILGLILSFYFRNVNKNKLERVHVLFDVGTG